MFIAQVYNEKYSLYIRHFSPLFFFRHLFDFCGISPFNPDSQLLVSKLDSLDVCNKNGLVWPGPGVICSKIDPFVIRV